ncbi:leucine-rich repeat domain-containing protein [Cellulophaga sp. HaHa_2_1]|uniref:leucine-rich repeat domain-containing protein n=1 Tax=Cellulophaga sp. HaHa_2_1 TaxID=2749994 RepID=UPI001C5012C3|nr:leucine-rich repeat domain-containing protein [Cellulophaga sp. HaHa_2_1]QXP53092.1 leucine-rich repeat domain-containing protein [Cellulophaga sp. HaHa_2_1]
MKYLTLAILSFFNFLSCDTTTMTFEIMNHPEVLFNTAVNPRNLTLKDIKIGDSVTIFDKSKINIRVLNYESQEDKKAKEIDFSLTKDINVSYEKGYYFVLNYGRVQSFLLSGTALNAYKNISKEDIERVFGKADKITITDDWDSGELTSTSYLYFDRNMEIYYRDDIRKGIWSISIGNLPRKDLLLIEDEKEKLEITSLDLSNSNLAEVPEIIKDFKNLKVLKLSKNSISKLPNWIGSLKHLETLEIELNKLEGLPEDIGKLSKLETIWLSNNNIKELPDSFCDLKSLTTLSIENNELSHLPKNIGNLSNLEFLFATDNSLYDIPESIGNMKNLYYLFLEKNRLKDLPADIQHCKKLHKLRLTKNYILEENKAKIDSLTSCSPWFDLNSVKAIKFKNLKDTIIAVDGVYYYVK